MRQQKISWQYLAGFYDGEGTIGLRVIREKRKERLGGELGGWYVSPYAQFANTNKIVMEVIKNFLVNEGIISNIVSIRYSKRPNNQDGYYLAIQAWDGLKKFSEKIGKYSVIKKEQLDIFEEVYRIRENLPILKNKTAIDNLGRKFWDKASFMRVMDLRDKLKKTKSRRKTRHKYDYKFFKESALEFGIKRNEQLVKL